MLNTYWLLRHGRSLANEAGLIVSRPENGILPQWGLADKGRHQATAAGVLLSHELTQLNSSSHQEQGPVQPQAHVYQLVVVSSPFRRTIETAELAAAQVGLPASVIQVDDALRERYFGAVNELQPAAGRYDSSWAADEHDLDSRPGGDGESVNMVVGRLKELFQRLEASYQGKQILLVAHGDTLSICQAAMSPGGDLHHHFKDCAFETAQLKRLN